MDGFSSVRVVIDCPTRRPFLVMDTPSPPPIPPPAPGSDKLLAILCHVSLFLGVGFILPLIVYLVKRGESAFVAAHAKEVLNFHISLVLYSICALPLVFFLIGIPILVALGLLGFICAIIAAVRASEGGFYFYPLTIRFIT
jgi:uncharacterized Tic20 family protein